MSTPSPAAPGAVARRTDDRPAPTWPRAVGGILLRLVAGWIPIIALMYGVGLLVTGPLKDDWPLSQEDELNAGLEAARTPSWNDLTHWFTTIGDTPVIIGTCAVVALVLRLAYGRWRESLFVITATWTQSVVFLSTTLLIDRQRPDVERLDPAPPTSSFPSGHTAATTALYCSIALVLVWHSRRWWVRSLAVLLVVVPPVLVATSRLYRGMHHPTDIAGSLVVAVLGLLLTWHVVLKGRLPRSEEPVEAVEWDRQRRGGRGELDAAPAAPRLEATP